MTTRRHWLALSCTLAVASTLSAPVALAADDYPNKAISIVVPYPPGGSNDTIARIVAERLSRDLGTIVVENRPGAGGNVGASSVARAKPDGYTLLLSTGGPLSSNATLYRDLPYDPLKSFTPISMIASVPILLAANPQAPFQTLPELIAYAKANPGHLSYASQGNGSSSHLTMELLKREAGIDMVHIPYRGSAPAAADLIGGQVPVMFDNTPTTLPHVRGGKMRALGVASAQPVPGLEDIAPIANTVPGFESEAWFALVGPAGMPEAVVTKLNQAVNTALTDPEVINRFQQVGATLRSGTPQALQDTMASETAKWAEIIEHAQIKLD